MSQDHPELIFVAGPQSGQRVVLTRPVAVLGRGGGADVLFSEEYISRNQARYELLRAGPVLENLSARGTWINGKRYKTGRQVLLETGDLIGVGEVTQILFVAAGDDSKAALAMYRESVATGKDAFGRKPRLEKATSPPSPEPELVVDEGGQQDEAEVNPKHPSELSATERLEAEQKARRRKIAIGLGIYLAAIIVIAIVLKARTGGTDKPWPEPPKLTGEKIAEFIRTPVQRTPNQFREEEELKKAVGLYRQYGMGDSYRLYDCLVAFKEALAYRDEIYFNDPEHDQMYRAVLDKLTETVGEKYDKACLLEKAEEWEQAEREFFEILRIYRDQSGGLFENIRAHHERVRHFHQKSKPKKRRMFG
ncbi:MAG: FHA domain-containing protein [Phycisphaerae bacterium]|nr:FHA domain-containing protein [Phycisphaerae bacterium]